MTSFFLHFWMVLRASSKSRYVISCQYTKYFLHFLQSKQRINKSMWIYWINNFFDAAWSRSILWRHDHALYAYMHIYIYTYIHTCTHMKIWFCYIHIHIHIHIHKHIQIHIHIHTNIFMADKMLWMCSHGLRSLHM